MELINTYERWSDKLQNIQEYQLFADNGDFEIFCQTYNEDESDELIYIGEIADVNDFVKTCDDWHESNMS